MSLPPPYIVGSLWGLSEICLALFKRAKRSGDPRDRHSLGLIWFVYIFCTILGVIVAIHLPSWSLPWWREIRVLGFCLFAAGMVLRWIAIIWLGRFFTVNVAIAADHRVIQTGPYRWMRHPSYAGALLMVLGFSLSLDNAASLAAIFIPCTAALLWRIRIEEAALTQSLGGQYESYMRRTKRLVPFLY